MVSEKRPYASWCRPDQVSRSQGIIEGRNLLNKLHTWLAEHGYSQVFVDQMNSDIVGITRHNPRTHETVVVVSHTSFSKNYIDWPGGLKHIPIGGVLENVIFEMKLKKVQEEWGTEDPDVLIGLKNYEMEIRENVNLDNGTMFKVHDGYIELTNFPTGSVVGFKIRPSDEATKAFNMIHNSISKRFSFKKLIFNVQFQLQNNLNLTLLSLVSHINHSQIFYSTVNPRTMPRYNKADTMFRISENSSTAAFRASCQSSKKSAMITTSGIHCAKISVMGRGSATILSEDWRNSRSSEKFQRLSENFLHRWIMCLITSVRAILNYSFLIFTEKFVKRR